MEQLCGHGYAHASNLSPGFSLSVCAVCFTEARIGEVKVAQAALTRRGGIFDSSDAGPEWCSTDGDVKKWMNHRDWTKQWRRTRLNCWRLVATLEKLRDEQFDMVEGWGIDEALYLWELAKYECSQVPGYRYVEDSASTEEAEMLQSRDIQAAPKPALMEEDPSEGDWETVKRRWKKRSQPLTSSLQDGSEKADTDEVILKEMEGVTNRLEDLGFTSENRFEALAKDSKRATAGVAEPMEKPRCILNGDPTPAKFEFVQKTAPTKPRLALKRTSSSPPQSRKCVVIDAQATILPSDNTSATTMSHHKHTFAENNHTRLSYNRNSRFYTPSCWASPEGYEKDNTSFHKNTWMTVDRLQKEFETSEEVSEEDSNEKDEALTEKAEEAATEEEKKAEKGEETCKSPFQARLPPWQSGQKMFSMKRRSPESITKG